MIVVRARQLQFVAVLSICLLCFLAYPTTIRRHPVARGPHLQSLQSTALESNETGALCDDECLRLHSNVSSWSADRPRAVIVMLVKFTSLFTYGQSVHQLHANWNAEYRYPIILFHEPELDAETERDMFRAQTPDPSLLYFQRVPNFDIPPFVNKSNVPAMWCYKDVAYRHMCRFHAKTVYELPILDVFRYVLRLDDDSLIASPVGYDIFRMMADRQYVYGYALVCKETEDCITGLWPAVDQYISERGIRRKMPWKRDQVFFNNFEVSDLDLWRSRQYRDYIDYIDRLGGIYLTRWGDAPIKTIAVTLFASNEQIHQFSDFQYFHKGPGRLC